MKQQDETIHLSEHDLQAQDWENALHVLLWEQGQQDLFYKIQAKAMAMMKGRVRKELTRVQ
jgi:hypothetical protein